VDDVTNLLAIAAGLPYADAKNVFFYGLSRGGMMTFLALRHGAVVNAAAVVGAVYDLQDALNTIKRQSPALAERPEKVNVPLLMIHGGQDDEVPVAQALAFAGKVNALHKQYQLLVYDDDIHEAAQHREERDAAIVGWFKRFTK
jgi:dipeptidyl aminopeptidase/acylaminoacyl peptidase